MGTKWAPRFVRILETMPVTATRKISKPSLRRESWTEPGEVYVSGDLVEADARSGPAPFDEYRPLTSADRATLLARYGLHGRRPAGV